MNMREGRSEFLTEIAKGYDSRIVAVTLLSQRYLRGRAFRVESVYEVGSMKIELRTDNHICEHHLLHTFFHEVGHVALGHCDRGTLKLTHVEVEVEAEDWAFRQTGMVDHNGQVKQVNETCYYCIDRKLKTCLKGFNFQGCKDE